VKIEVRNADEFKKLLEALIDELIGAPTTGPGPNAPKSTVSLTLMGMHCALRGAYPIVNR
jgi:hypothetical protein